VQVVSIINYKGGVGKTSLTANLGGELAWRGKKVLLLIWTSSVAYVPFIGLRTFLPRQASSPPRFAVNEVFPTPPL